MLQNSSQLRLLRLKVTDQLKMHVVELLLERVDEDGLLFLYYLFNYLFLFIG